MNFTNDIEETEMNEVISNKRHVVVKIKHNCYCYDNNPRRTMFFVVSSEGNGIRVRDLVNKLTEERYEAKCNHQFLEGFDRVNDITFEAFFGS